MLKNIRVKKFVLKNKLYFDGRSSTCISWPIRSPDWHKGRTTEVEVREPK